MAKSGLTGGFGSWNPAQSMAPNPQIAPGRTAGRGGAQGNVHFGIAGADDRLRGMLNIIGGGGSSKPMQEVAMAMLAPPLQAAMTKWMTNNRPS